MLDFSNATSGSQSIFTLFLICIILVAVGIELWKYFYTGSSSGYLFTNTRSTFEPETYEQTNPHLMSSSRNQASGQEFSYSFWLLIRQNIKESDKKERIVLSRGNSHVHRGHPCVFLGGPSGTLETMTVRVRTYPHHSNHHQHGDEVSHMDCVIQDLPLRRWFHVAVCGSNNAVDVFINGKLAQHSESPQPLQTSSGPLFINQNGGFDGFMSKLHYGNYMYTIDSMYSMIQSGPSPIPNLNQQYGTDIASGSASGGNGGGLPNKWWSNQGES